MSSVTTIQDLQCAKSLTTEPSDIRLVDTLDKIWVVPQSILGVLWLQTHFDESHWDDLTNGAVVLKPHNASMLVIDAESGGLTVHYH